MNRGDRLEEIFKDDPDRERFLAALGGGLPQAGWQVHNPWLKIMQIKIDVRMRLLIIQ